MSLKVRLQIAFDGMNDEAQSFLVDMAEGLKRSSPRVTRPSLVIVRCGTTGLALGGASACDEHRLTAELSGATE